MPDSNAPPRDFRHRRGPSPRYAAAVSSREVRGKKTATCARAWRVTALLAAAALSAALLGAPTIGRADKTRGLGGALHGAAGGPLALAATRLFARLERDAQGGPRLEAPGLAHELERSWSVAPEDVLVFDAMGAVFDLASVLDAVPALPRLDGHARSWLAHGATSEAVSNAAGCAPVSTMLRGATPCDRFVDAATLAAARRGERTAAPGAGLRGASSRLLRSFGFGSISGQPVLVLEGADDPAAVARQDLDALAWLHLPPRPLQGPEVDDDMAMLALRARRGRGAMGVTTKVTIRSATVRLIGTF